MFGKSLFQPEYRILKKALEEKLPKEAVIRLFNNQQEIQKLNVSPSALIEEMAKNLNKKSDINGEFMKHHTMYRIEEILSLDYNNLIIFDDLMLEKKNKCKTYCIRGWHSNVECFYSCQNYFILPRQKIRENANFIVLFKQDPKT